MDRRDEDFCETQRFQQTYAMQSNPVKGDDTALEVQDSINGVDRDMESDGDTDTLSGTDGSIF